jgi:glycolate oxidase iron-sulfur subunit
VAEPLLRRAGRALAASGRLPRVAAALALAPPPVTRSRGRAQVTTAAGDGPRERVGLVSGCVQRVFFGHVNDASARVLGALGYDVVVPSDQGCCGALSVHAGRVDEARILARRLIATFERAGVERVSVNVAGCGSVLKRYGHLLADDPEWAARARAFAAKVRDVTELAVERAAPAELRHHALPLRVAYHDACHLAHAQGIRDPPRALLARIPGVTIVPLAEPGLCCGSAGIYNLLLPDTASELGDRAVVRLDGAAPDVVATGNPGCLLQIAASAARAGRTWPVKHTIELVDASLRGLRREEVVGPGA